MKMSPAEPKRLIARFFQTRAGSVPVREWLADMPREDRRVVGADLARVELGWPIGMPTCRALGKGLWEVRSTIRQGRVEVRVLFYIDGSAMVLLHGFLKSPSRQDHDISIGRDRLADYLSRKDPKGS